MNRTLKRQPRSSQPFLRRKGCRSWKSSYRLGDFRLNGGLTLTNAEIVGANDKSIIGKTPRQARTVYQLTPTYNMGDVDLGCKLIYQQVMG